MKERTSVAEAGSGSWLQTADVWERIAKHHPEPARYMDALLELIARDFAHRHMLERSVHRLNWAQWCRQLLGVVAGFAAFAVCAFIAVRYLEAGNGIQGAWILCTGSIPITTLFVTGAVVRPPRVVQEIAAPVIPAQVPPAGV